MNNLQKEFENSLTALMIRYNVRLVNESNSISYKNYVFRNSDESIYLRIVDIETEKDDE